jgi:hypothetical protein
MRSLSRQRRVRVDGRHTGADGELIEDHVVPRVAPAAGGELVREQLLAVDGHDVSSSRLGDGSGTEFTLSEVQILRSRRVNLNV